MVTAFTGSNELAVDGSGSERIQLVRTPQASPGTCAVCGTSASPGFLDFNLDFEFYGSLYLCIECAHTVGRAVGMMSADAVENVKADREHYLNETNRLQDELDKANAVVDSFSAFHNKHISRLSDDTRTYSTNDSASTLSSTKQDYREILNTANPAPTDDVDDVLKSVNLEGPDHISEPTGGDQSEFRI